MSANVRYIVNNVEEALPFYTQMLGFKIDMHPAPGFAALSKGDLKLFLNQPGAGGAGQSMPDGTVPAPGGWNRIQFEVSNIESFVEKLKKIFYRKLKHSICFLLIFSIARKIQIGYISHILQSICVLKPDDI